MPIYKYKCEKCNHAFEKIVAVVDRDKVKCEKCKKSPRRLFTKIDVTYKGTGFYATDYKKAASDCKFPMEIKRES